MKIIDKDSLEDAVQGAINVMESHGVSMIAASVPLAVIKVVPTVEAIPVEWLKGLMLSTDDDVDKVEFAWIMQKWQNEQGEESDV